MKKFLFRISIIIMIVFSVLFTKHYLLNIDDIKDSFHKKDDYFCNKEIKLFKTIEQGLLKNSKLIKVDSKLIDYNTDDIITVTINKITLENPEIMYLKGGKYANGFFSPEYSKSKQEIMLHQSQISSKREEIISKIIKSDMSDYEKVKVIHDYIINNSNYDKRYIKDEIVPDESYTVYGLLVKNVGVCEGYAKTMKYLLDSVDIESIIVKGESKGLSHAWNIVNIEGDYYHVDPTWDDPVTGNGEDVLSYNYLNLTDEEMEYDHTWNRGNYPPCNASKYNYYYYNNLVVDNYNDFYDKIEDALDNKNSLVEVKVLNFIKDDYNIPDIVNLISKNKADVDRVREYRYSINFEQGIIRIEFYF